MNDLTQTNSPMVEASHLGKVFGAKRVLHDLSLHVAPGDVIGVLGKNGAGKTTLLELMLGFTPPTTGTVRLFGHESCRLPGDAKARVGFVPQQDELLDPLTVADQLRVIASFYPRWNHELMTRLCGQWGLDERARIRSLSVGERQKLSILLAFGHEPELLILDEPVASLDPIARRQFLEQLVEISADGRRAIIFSSHIVSDIERLANRIWMLKAGQLDWQGDLDSLKESIVRLHLRSSRPLPPTLSIPGAISIRHDAARPVAVVRDWSAAAQADVERQIGGTVEVEPLGLEEIFLELHR
jgi:ABC-2 type transport system ATP-binding protein